MGRNHPKYGDMVEQVWSKAQRCHCGNDDCTRNNHRVCAECGLTIIYGAYEAIQPESNYSWHTHISYVKDKPTFKVIHTDCCQVPHPPVKKDK